MTAEVNRLGARMAAKVLLKLDRIVAGAYEEETDDGGDQTLRTLSSSLAMVCQRPKRRGCFLARRESRSRSASR